ncbi:MAG: DUF5674 family protein [Chloroflexota bacterium]
MEIVRTSTSLTHVHELAAARFGDLVKVVVDVERGIMAIDAGMHADEEAALVQDGSDQRDLWGVNLYPAEHGTEGWLEFDSMINLRPGQGNRTRSVDDPVTRSLIARIVDRLVMP